MRITKISYRHQLLGAVELCIQADYRFQATSPARSARMFNRNIGAIRAMSASLGISLREVEVDGHSFIDVDAVDTDALNEGSINLTIEFDESSFREMNNSPFCTFPSHLPLLLASHTQYPAVEDQAGLEETVTPARIEVDPELIKNAGYVLDLSGAYLMVTSPIRRDIAKTIWYRDEKLILGGEGWRKQSPERQTAFARRLHEVHQFLDRLYGRGDRVRAFVLSESGAARHVSGRGQAVVIEDDWFDVSEDQSWFVAERIVVRQMAAMWWSSGVAVGGSEGAFIEIGLTFYSVLRWFEETGKPAELAAEIARMAKYTAAGDDVTVPMENAARLALCLYDHSGLVLDRELKQWCAEYWGTSVGVDLLRRRLSAKSIQMPF